MPVWRAATVAHLCGVGGGRPTQSRPPQAPAIALFTPIPPALAADGDFSIGDPWISLPIYDEAPRVYFSIRNPTAKARRIVGATSPRCRSIGIRIATFEGGTEGSKELTGIEIPAGGAVAFSPRGYFFELVDSESLAEGEKVPLELELDDRTKVRFEAEVRDE